MTIPVSILGSDSGREGILFTPVVNSFPGHEQSA